MAGGSEKVPITLHKASSVNKENEKNQKKKKKKSDNKIESKKTKTLQTQQLPPEFNAHNTIYIKHKFICLFFFFYLFFYPFYICNVLRCSSLFFSFLFCVIFALVRTIFAARHNLMWGMWRETKNKKKKENAITRLIVRPLVVCSSINASSIWSKCFNCLWFSSLPLYLEKKNKKKTHKIKPNPSPSCQCVSEYSDGIHLKKVRSPCFGYDTKLHLMI